ncbi:MAG: CHAT domain-containing protein [Chitinophagales bacterium]
MSGDKEKRSWARQVCLLFSFFILHIHLDSFAQCPSSETIQSRLLSIENDTAIDFSAKIKELEELKVLFENCHLPNDSVYARILHKAGIFQYRQNNFIATPTSIEYTLRALSINLNAGQRGSKSMALNSCFNLGHYYKSLGLINKSLNYFDSTIQLAGKFPGMDDFKIDSRYQKCLIYFVSGDYQKAVLENSIGIIESRQVADFYSLSRFFNQRGQALLYQGRWKEAGADIDSALKYLHDGSDDSNNGLERTTSMAILAKIYGKEGRVEKAGQMFTNAIRLRIQSKNDRQVADDYIDFGNLLLENQRFEKAKSCYNKAITFAKKAGDGERLSKAHVNLGETAFDQKDYESATKFYELALQGLMNRRNLNVFQNPAVQIMAALPNKELITVILGNKTELFLNQYKKTHDARFLRAALDNAIVSDSLLTQIRHEQSEELSKLYWRNRTRELFSHAMEACWLARDWSLAFFFMEKSRAVLLNDKLNETGASAKLPKTEAAKEQTLQHNIVFAQQALNALSADQPSYAGLQLKLFKAKEEFEHYTKSLEQKYPVYYQYKYADDLPSLKSLQDWLAINQQKFVDYFMEDTVTYILVIQPSGPRMIRLSRTAFDLRQAEEFLSFCQDEQRISSHFDSFSKISWKLYRALFESLQLPRGRVIICPDNFLLPFEALSTDSSGMNFLLKDYSFSYVYSARYLLREFEKYPASGNFIGFAPVNFSPYLNLVNLDRSSQALTETASPFHGVSLFTGTDASKKNFLEKLSGFTLAMIFSHGRADTTEAEPTLFMQDSVIRLSELQILKQPSTSLVVLSACQTQVGKNATGEGIYSLSRGFASAGIPSVAATLWEANDQSIYRITELFSENLARGMRKDEALTQAKLEFLKTSSKSKTLPYYWANLVLTGNTDPIEFTAKGNDHWLMILFSVIGIAAALFVYYKFLRKNGIGPNS